MKPLPLTQAAELLGHSYRALAWVLLPLVVVPVWPLGLWSAWRAQRRLRAYGPGLDIPLADRPRSRLR